VKLFVQRSAREDILRQIDWYGEKGLADVAFRFRLASYAAFDAMLRMPAAGPPRLVRNPRLAGLRTWPINEFEEFRGYYIVEPELVIVVRVLHDKRDVAAILAREKLERP